MLNAKNISAALTLALLGCAAGTPVADSMPQSDPPANGQRVDAGEAAHAPVAEAATPEDTALPPVVPASRENTNGATAAPVDAAAADDVATNDDAEAEVPEAEPSVAHAKEAKSSPKGKPPVLRSGPRKRQVPKAPKKNHGSSGGCGAGTCG